MPKQHSWKSLGKELFPTVWMHEDSENKEKTMCNLPPPTKIGSWIILPTNTAATRKCVGKITRFIRRHSRETLPKLKYAQEGHQFSMESLGSDTHLTEMSKVIPIWNEVRSIMIFMWKGCGPLLHSTKPSSYKLSCLNSYERFNVSGKISSELWLFLAYAPK